MARWWRSGRSTTYSERCGRWVPLRSHKALTTSRAMLRSEGRGLAPWPSLLPLFTEPRRRGILRSSYTRSCITPPLSGRRMAYFPARVPNLKPYMLRCCIKMRSGAYPVVTKSARGERENSPFCPDISSVASGAAGVGEGPAPRRDEPPLVALRMEGELQDAVGMVVVDLAVGDGLKDGVVALPSRANHKLPDPTLGICSAVRVLLREALVVVLMAVEHHVYARCVQSVP